MIAARAAVSAVLVLLTLACGDSHRPSPATARDEDAVPVFSTLPEFRLTDQSGEPYGSVELAGKFWVGNFIFTRCPGTCPVQTRYVKLLQDRLARTPRWPEIRLVSFTVDPKTDTPDVLAEYARRVGADPEHWVFLTGGREEIWQLSKDAFKLPVGDAPPGGDGPILHATKLMLIDGGGRLRGYYDGMSEEGLDELGTDLQRLLDEP